MCNIPKVLFFALTRSEEIGDNPFFDVMICRDLKGQRLCNLGLQVLHQFVGIGPHGEPLRLGTLGCCNFENKVVIDSPDQRLAILVSAAGSKGDEDCGRSGPASLPRWTGGATIIVRSENNGFIEHAFVGLGAARVAEIGFRPWVTNNLNHGLGHDARGVGGHILILTKGLFVGGVGDKRGSGGRRTAKLGESRFRLAHPWKGVERRDAFDSRGDHLWNN